MTLGLLRRDRRARAAGASRRWPDWRYTSPMLGLLMLLGVAALALLVLLTAMLAWEMRHPPRRTLSFALARGLPGDPAELGLEFQEWVLERPGNVRLPVWDISPPDSKSQARARASLTAVFVHGWGLSRFDLLSRVPLFAAHCQRLILYDQRGHGEASGTSRLGDGEQHDLMALLERTGEPRVVLVGHSMGAVIAMHAAAEANRRRDSVSAQIAGIIAYGAYCNFRDSLRGRLNVAGYPSRPVSDLAMLVHRMMGVRPLNLTPQVIAETNCPILFIHGSSDRVAAIEHVRSMSRDAAMCTLHVIQDAEHTDTHLQFEDHDHAVAQFIESLRLRA